MCCDCRPHSAPSCYQAGYVSNGVFSGTVTGSCPNGPPPYQQWFTIKLVVQTSGVEVQKDGTVVTSLTPHFAQATKVGVLAANGYDNTIHYRNLRVTEC